MAENVDTTIDQARLVVALQSPDAYSHDVGKIHVVETHISWVFLTGSFAYKVKKAVTLDFLNFGTLEQRHRYCEEELRLNRRWAPELYLDVVAISGSMARPRVEGAGEAVEYAVKMVQFPADAQLDRQLDAGLLNETDMLRLAEKIAGYHDDAPIIEYANDRESVLKVRAPMLENFAPLEQVLDMELLSRVQRWTDNTLRTLKPTLIQRRKDGFVRECHGDLHLANLVRLPSGIAAFDCVEFSAELRNIDVISDVAFLFMDLVARARQDLAAVFLNRYLERTGDYAGMRVFALYFVYHCMIRAKVAAIRSTERARTVNRDDDIGNLKHNLAVAARWIDRRPPLLIAMHGYSGSGKTCLSSDLVARLPAIRLRSDVERKRLFQTDDPSGDRSLSESGRYTQRARGEVYQALLVMAESILAEGLNVIIDASFLRKADRESVVDFANRRNVPLAFVSTHAGERELMQRLERRQAARNDESDADVDVLRFQIASADDFADDEQAPIIRVATDEEVDLDIVIKRILAATISERDRTAT
jgi:hypothetical protein